MALRTLLGLHGPIQGLAHVGDLIQGCQLKLTNADLLAVHVKVLVVAMQEIHRRHPGNRAFGLQHFHEERVGILDAGNLLQGGNRLLVILGAGGRLEIDGVAQDRGQHHAGNLRVDPDASALVQIRQHGAGAADRHGAEKNGAVGGDIANLVVVNHGQQFGLGEVVRGLGQIVVIDQRNLLSRSVRHLLRC